MSICFYILKCDKTYVTNQHVTQDCLSHGDDRNIFIFSSYHFFYNLFIQGVSRQEKRLPKEIRP